MEAENQHQELDNRDDLVTKKSPDFEEPASITWLKEQYNRIQTLTAKNISDNIWLIALKFIIKGFMILILIILSPFILFFLLLSLLIAG
ncbi:MAG: hypothetical protein AB8G11_26075 [Saprospiraceae bacterium]